MGCYIGLTQTITHHLHLTDVEAKTETVGAVRTSKLHACVCMWEEKVATGTKRCRDKVCVCVIISPLNWMGGHVEVKSRLYWIIKRNWVALITLLLLSPMLASDTDRAEKDTQTKTPQEETPFCYSLCSAFPFTSWTKTLFLFGSKHCPTLYHCWAELSTQAVGFTPRGSQFALQFQHAPLWTKCTIQHCLSLNVQLCSQRVSHV